ncbi:hypothetical protein MKZ38_002048 [Zalerion maritima]|uniref:Uncharacterized protein n=1 Tax=Zalerion maritima TaxID=339359 RepID=A0AAD5WXD3_9PEZI|nr:hypothetical protein MKZ38_002048 [Zalerion maritima]
MPINHPAVASAGVIAISVAVAAAIAVYESPELRRMAEDLRRKIALAFHSFGDVIEPNTQQPLFNRPEDAEGFLQSHGAADPGVVADEATLRRQREELMYWNAIQLENQARELQRAQEEARMKQSGFNVNQPLESSQTSDQPRLRRGTTFDDFLSPANGADAGTFVYNTGASIRPNDEGLVQRRLGEVSRGLHSSVFSNPFSDEHQIMDEPQASYAMMAPDHDEMPDRTFQSSPPSVPTLPCGGMDTEITSDIYDDVPTPKRRLSVPQADAPAPLEWSHPEGRAQFPSVPVASQPQSESPAPSSTVGRTPEPDAGELSTTGQDGANNDAFASIQAWAQSQNSNPSFYSPIPVSPAAPLSAASEPDVISYGDLTPTETDSLSLAGSGVDVANEVGSRAGDNFDIISDSTGMATPASWSEVGSVVSEDDHPVHA